MPDKREQNNQATIQGKIVSPFTFSHEKYGERFYLMDVFTKRLSNSSDRIPVIISGQLVDVTQDCTGEFVREEYVYLICMNTKCSPIGFFETSHGTCNMALVSPREILIRSLLCNAANIVLVHNHPSGDPAPSREDDQMTRRIQTAAGIIGIDFLDHIIIGEETYYSYCMDKRLENKAENSFVA